MGNEDNKMSDFIETINGRNYTIDEAKQIYINYTLRHGGKITQRFRDCKVKIYPNQLPNGSRALANSNAETNQINMREEQSIVTFFHECGHLRKAWQDSSGIWHTNWENETDYTAQMSYEDTANNIVCINRGTKGLAMGEAEAELYASKVYWDLCGNTPQAYAYTATRTQYDEEIINLKKIALVLGINEDELLSWDSENDYGRNQLRGLFTKLTGREEFWDSLEYRLDYVSMPTFIRLSHPSFRISDTSLRNVALYRDNLNDVLKVCLKKDVQKRYYQSMGCSENEFEQIYQQKINQYKQLEKQLMQIRGGNEL